MLKSMWVGGPKNMLYTERLKFIEEYIAHWAAFDDCEPIENGFKAMDCSAIFIESGFNIRFGFYDPEGKKLAEYSLDMETGVALMLYDERYAEGRNDYTGILADILGGLLGTEEYFTLINKPVTIYEDAPEPMSFEDIWKDIISSMEKDDHPEEI